MFEPLHNDIISQERLPPAQNIGAEILVDFLGQGLIFGLQPTPQLNSFGDIQGTGIDALLAPGPARAPP